MFVFFDKLRRKFVESNEYILNKLTMKKCKLGSKIGSEKKKFEKINFDSKIALK